MCRLTSNLDVKKSLFELSFGGFSGPSIYVSNEWTREIPVDLLLFLLSVQSAAQPAAERVT